MTKKTAAPAKNSAAATPAAETRNRYRYFSPLQTRWADNDIYGHVNNVTYYAYFDTVINCYLIEKGGLDIADGRIVGFAVETMCRFFVPIAYPDELEAGLRVGKIGNSSVRYEVGIFRKGEKAAAAAGHFIHVFVDRRRDRPTAIPKRIRAALEKIKVKA
ncbi:MAG: acyl-CoA thioesterase [Alphaproteobacteria bacterium]|nr:acyl-CoA thioesterase [Alphaproteobacteria bacterium]